MLVTAERALPNAARRRYIGKFAVGILPTACLTAGVGFLPVDDVASIGRTTAEESDPVSPAAEERTASVRQVASSVESLTERAETLQTRLQTFRVTDTAVDRSDATPSEIAADGRSSED